MTEDELLKFVVDRALALELLVFHSTDPRRDTGRGFPDLVLAGPRGVIFAELKATHGVFSDDQKAWAKMLTMATSGQPWSTWVSWYPADWDAGFVERTMRLIC